MQKAFANAHGQFGAKAHKAGMSTQAYASKMAHSPKASTKTKRQANLAKLGAKYGGHAAGGRVHGEGEKPKHRADRAPRGE